VASGLTADEAVSRAQSVLSGLGVRTTRTGDVISTISPWWSVWGSPLFHWSLVALVAVIALGTTLRSDGVMALAVGQSKADMPASYLTVTAGPLRAWTRSPRHIRLDSLEPDLRVGGIDRGAVPTVAVLDSRGSVIARQRVYPNMMLHSGSLSINAPTVGLSVTMAIIDTTGEESSRFIQLVDFSQVATEGTVPASALQFTDLAGNRLITSVTVPLDRAGSGFGEWIPKTKRARVEIADASGSGISQLVGQGQDVLLPSGEALRLIDIGWYSGLSIVDDPTVPFVYGVMALALIGLTLTLLMRQQYFVATYADRDGPHLVVAIRLWGNAPTDRREIVMELEQALASPVKGNTL